MSDDVVLYISFAFCIGFVCGMLVASWEIKF